MADVVDRQTRSRMMASIRGRDTRPEVALRRQLHRLGHRYRLGGRGLPGRPDIVFPRYRAAIFVHGCFWHQHEECRWASIPTSNVNFWREKFAATRARDRRCIVQLSDSGWKVAIIWECAIKHSLGDLADEISGWLMDPSSNFMETALIRSTPDT